MSKALFHRFPHCLSRTDRVLPNAKAATRSSSIDILKFLLAMMVVALHSQLLQDTHPLAGYLLTNGIFRLAVPIFFIINGYYLCEVMERGQFASWLRRVASLYIFWMLVYAPFWLAPTENGSLSAAHILHRALFGYHHLWYIAAMAGAAILIILKRKFRFPVVISLACISFLAGVIIQYSGSYNIFPDPLDSFFDYNWSHRNLIFFAFPFMVLGISIMRFRSAIAPSCKLVFLGAFIGVSALISESMFNFTNGVGIDGFDNLLSLALASPLVFMLAIFINLGWNTKWIASAASGIYFIHPIFIHLSSSYFANSMHIFLASTLLSLVASLFLIIASKRFSFVI